jgi:transcriptional regulator with XRE-family HTH domain
MATARRSDAPAAPAGMQPGGGPTVLRMTLGGQLRRLRESRGISREQAGEAIRGSHAKISRLELGRVGFKERDIADLLTLYAVTDPDEREAFLALARQANSPGWWHRYGDLLPGWFEVYLGLEQSASVLRCYEGQFVPGLLQTADYARAVIRLAHGRETPNEIDRRVDLRMRRQEVLGRPDPPVLWAVIDESALHRPIGGVPVMRAQLERLIAAAERPNVKIQVLPYEVGGHAAAGGPFTILRFPEADLPDVVYMEQLTSALYLDKRPDVDRYLAVMDQLSVTAEPPDKTPGLLRKLLESL